MAKKMEYETLVARILGKIEQLAPENCETIKQAYDSAMQLANFGLCAAPRLEDYVYCKTCGRPCWRGDCAICQKSE